MKIPFSVIQAVEKEAAGLDFGEVTLSVFLRDGHVRYEICRKRSVLAETFLKPPGNEKGGEK
jgi:hypothetical protein